MSDRDSRDQPASDTDAEPRVRDMLASDDPDELDPELIARLAAWFGPAPPQAPPPPEDPERAEMRAARERAMAAVEPAMLDALVGRGERYGQTATPPAPARFISGEISRFDLASWGIRSAFGEREREIPEEIYDALGERTPQALLRDLHRPESRYDHVSFDQVDLGVDLAGARARALVTETIGAIYAIRMAEEPIPRRLMREDRAGLRALLDAPWQDSKPRRPTPLAEVVDAATLMQQADDDGGDG